MATTKRRDVVFRQYRSYPWYYDITRYTDVQIVGGQTTTSSDSLYPATRGLIRRYQAKIRKGSKKKQHHLLVRRLRNADYGTGDFVTAKNVYTESGREANQYHKLEKFPFQYVNYTGPIFAKARVVGPTSDLWPVNPTQEKLLLYAKGSTAISRVLPTNPASGLGVALGELREGIPQIVGSQLLSTRARDYRKIGSEYLNVEFGWKPLIQDVTSIAQTVKDSDKILAQYERDSGKHIRRRFDFPEEVVTTVTETPGQTATPTLNTYFWTSYSGTLVKTRSVTSNTWFSGCFSYFLSAGDSAKAKMKKAEQEAAKLLGVRLTPDLLYQLAPWSWLIDWNSNLGDVIRNVSAFANDGLVMRWGYIMSTRTISDSYTLKGVSLRDGTLPISQTFTSVSKVRLKATPYGFGLDTGDYTSRQWAILAALGISKGPRQL